MDTIDILIQHTKSELENQRRQLKTLNGRLQDLQMKYNKGIDRNEELALLVKQNEDLREALEEIEREKINGKIAHNLP